MTRSVSEEQLRGYVLVPSIHRTWTSRKVFHAKPWETECSRNAPRRALQLEEQLCNDFFPRATFCFQLSPHETEELSSEAPGTPRGPHGV